MTNPTAYKYRIKGRRSVRQLNKLAKSINFVWNYCTETQKKSQNLFKQGLKSRWFSHYDLAKMCLGAANGLGIHAQSVQCITDQFVKSRDQNKKCPRFRSSKNNLGWIPFQRQSRQLKDSSITYLGHTFTWFGSKRRPLPSVVKGGCFVEDSRGRWYVCLTVEADQKPTGTGEVGIDLGLKTLATLSTGEKIENPTYYRQLEEKLGTAQRAGNKKRVKAIHSKIKNRRQDYLHKASSKIAKENRLIVVGDVSSSQLGQTKMAKSVYDTGWSTLRYMLKYKASMHSATYKEVDEKFTTQTCSSCHLISDNSPKGRTGLGIRQWECSNCGTHHDRDVNAARNILAIGLSTQPLAEESRA